MKKVEIDAYTHAELADKNATFGFLKISHNGALIRAEGEHLRVSDGYHTFDELYEHRIELFIALCRILAESGANRAPAVWRSHDGIFDGWFIMGIHKKSGLTITYHLPDSRWKDTDFAETLEHPPKWDGHTSNDVIKRLKKI